MEYQENRTTAKELISEINRLDEALLFFDDARSITVSATYKYQPKPTDERRLGCVELVNDTLYQRFHELISELASNHRADFLAFKNEVASQIDPRTAKFIWVYRNPYDPYVIGPWLTYATGAVLCFLYPPGTKKYVWLGDLPDEIGRAFRLKLAKGGVCPISDVIANCANVWQEYRDASTWISHRPLTAT